MLTFSNSSPIATSECTTRPVLYFKALRSDDDSCHMFNASLMFCMGNPASAWLETNSSVSLHGASIT